MQGLAPEVQRELLLTVGSHRANRPLSPVEVADALQAALDGGSSLGEIADKLHLEDTSVVSDFVRLLRLAPEVRHLVGWGRSNSTIGFKVASQIARLPELQEQVRLCHACLEHRLGVAETRQVLQLRERSKKPLEECVNDVLRLRPQIQRVHLFLGAVTSRLARSRLATFTQAQRDELLEGTIRRRFREIGAFGCRLGIDRFTITGGEKVAAALGKEGADFEGTINTDLAEAISP